MLYADRELNAVSDLHKSRTFHWGLLWVMGAWSAHKTRASRLLKAFEPSPRPPTTSQPQSQKSYLSQDSWLTAPVELASIFLLTILKFLFFLFLLLFLLLLLWRFLMRLRMSLSCEAIQNVTPWGVINKRFQLLVTEQTRISVCFAFHF